MREDDERQPLAVFGQSFTPRMVLWPRSISRQSGAGILHRAREGRTFGIGRHLVKRNPASRVSVGAERQGDYGETSESASGGKLRIWRAVFPDIALRGHAQVDIGIFGMGFGRTPGADL